MVKKAAAALGYLCFGLSGQPVPAAAGAAAAAGPAAAVEPAGAAADAGADGAAAATAPGSGSDGVLQPSVAALLALRTSKNEEVLFAVGEALCFCFGGARGLMEG